MCPSPLFSPRQIPEADPPPVPDSMMGLSHATHEPNLQARCRDPVPGVASLQEQRQGELDGSTPISENLRPLSEATGTAVVPPTHFTMDSPRGGFQDGNVDPTNPNDAHEALDTVRQQLDNMEEMRKTLEKELGEDAGEEETAPIDETAGGNAHCK